MSLSSEAELLTAMPTLSRLPSDSKDNKSETGGKAARLFNLSQLDAMPVEASHIAKQTRKDLILAKVLQYTLAYWPREV